MRGLGVRSPLRTEGTACACAPGQRHRDRNVRNQILSVKGVRPFLPSPDPRSGALSRGPGHEARVHARAPRSSTPRVVGSGAAGTRVWSASLLLLPPSIPNRKKEKKSPHESQPPPLVPPPTFTRTNPIVTCPWRHPKQAMQSHTRVIQSAQQPTPFCFFLFPARVLGSRTKIPHDSGTLPHLAEPRGPARRCGRSSPLAWCFNPCPDKCNAMRFDKRSRVARGLNNKLRNRRIDRELSVSRDTICRVGVMEWQQAKPTEWPAEHRQIHGEISSGARGTNMTHTQ